MARREGRHRPSVDGRGSARGRDVTHGNDEALREEGFSWERYSPAEEEGCGLERVELRSRALLVSGRGALSAIPRTGHALRGSSAPGIASRPLMEIDAVETPPGRGRGRRPRLRRSRSRGALRLPPQGLDRLLGGRLPGSSRTGELKGGEGRVDAPARRRPPAAAARGAVGTRQAGPRRATPAHRRRRGRRARRARRRRDASPGCSSRIGARSRPSRRGRSSTAPCSGPTTPARWKTDDERAAQHRAARSSAAPAAAGAGEAARRAERRRRAGRTAAATLVNAPANELTPTASPTGPRRSPGAREHLRFEALGPEEIEAAGMGAFVAVAQGSHNPPRLITLALRAAGAAHGRARPRARRQGDHLRLGRPLAEARRTAWRSMKSDMAGGAAVAGRARRDRRARARRCASSRSSPRCENMPGGHASRPGDIVTALNGKTIEITNTDAEGRLVLADALVHARAPGATHVVDLATLTGGDRGRARRLLRRALRQRRGLVLGASRAAAEASGDHAWRMPLHDALPALHRLRRSPT